MSDTRQQGQGGQKDDTVEGGPMRVKDRAAEKVGAAQEPLIRMPRSWPLGAAPTIPDPPPPCLKVERRGGGGGGGPKRSSSPLIRARSSGPSERCAPDSGPPPLA
jgi:hypothetical protein